MRKVRPELFFPLVNHHLQIREQVEAHPLVQPFGAFVVVLHLYAKPGDVLLAFQKLKKLGRKALSALCLVDKYFLDRDGNTACLLRKRLLHQRESAGLALVLEDIALHIVR